MLPRLLVKLIFSALLLLMCGACGYYREGQQSSGEVRPRLYVELIANETHRAFVNDVLTVQLLERFARSPLFTIVEDPAQAELILGGAVTLYETAPIAYSQLDTISAYRAELAVRATVRRPGAAQEMVWRNTLTTNQDYTSNNPDQVLPQSAERLVNDLYAQVTDTLFWEGTK